MKRLFLPLAVVLLIASPLWATWSIVAVDPETGEVGSAGASYTPSVWPILGIAGGRGVLVAQASGNDAMRGAAVQMLLRGLSPAEILENVTDLAENPGIENQQWAIAGLSGNAVGFTGADCWPWAGHTGDDTVMVQGNILVNESVTADTLAAFREAKEAGKPLAESLVRALAAGSAAGGDKRSGDPAIAAMTAYVAVAQPDDAPGYASFALIVPPLKNGGNPVKELERLYSETSDEKHPLYFPSLVRLLLLLVLFPAVIGLLMFCLLPAALQYVKGSVMILWAASLTGALALQMGIQLFLQLRGWALPVYGYFRFILPGMIVAALLLVFSALSIARSIIRKRRN